MIFYLHWDPRGEVEDFIPYQLKRLREHADTIVVTVNGELSAAGRARLVGLADEIWLRDNVGFDAWGHKSALERFGSARLAEYDELILMNSTCYGPFDSFTPLFDRMNASDVDFWGLTEHAEATPNPLTGRGTLARHLQSYWIAVRRRMFTDASWGSYWESLPTMSNYREAVLGWEAVFTEHFEQRGFVSAPAYRGSGRVDNPSIFDVDTLLDEGYPVLKRRLFFEDPAAFRLAAMMPSRLVERVEGTGYPRELIWTDLVRHVPPATLNTNASLLEILPEADTGYDPIRPLRIAVLAHIFYPDMTDELLGYCSTLPGYDLIVTTSDDERAAAIEASIESHPDPARGRVEVRVLESNNGRDMSAFLVGVADILRSRDYDLVFKLHTKRSPHAGYAAGEFFRRHAMANLLGSPGYTRNLLALFQDDPGLGIVYAPAIHVGVTVIGGGWMADRPPVEELCKRLGVRVPLDVTSPLAPFGSMFAARPEALATLTDVDWSYDDYPAPPGPLDGGLGHAQERIFSYVAAELGYKTKTVATPEAAALSHVFLEHELNALKTATNSYGPIAYGLSWLRRRHPRLARPLLRVYRRIAERRPGFASRTLVDGEPWF